MASVQSVLLPILLAYCVGRDTGVFLVRVLGIQPSVSGQHKSTRPERDLPLLQGSRPLTPASLNIAHRASAPASRALSPTFPSHTDMT
ncbi:hypothetical protein J6590_020506 [Homalodisca vitripennis]|nr:hypothetical protein J6590_020506 [Homalodisca vitripennis]